jgi:hypothetical protein
MKQRTKTNYSKRLKYKKPNYRVAANDNINSKTFSFEAANDNELAIEMAVDKRIWIEKNRYDE